MVADPLIDLRAADKREPQVRVAGRVGHQPYCCQAAPPRAKVPPERVRWLWPGTAAAESVNVVGWVLRDRRACGCAGRDAHPERAAEVMAAVLARTSKEDHDDPVSYRAEDRAGG